MNLDMRTIVWGGVIGGACCVGVMVVLWRQYRHRFAGIGFWPAGFALQFAAAALLAWRDIAPSWLAVIGSAMAVGGAILLYIGLEHFVQQRRSQIHNGVLLLVFVLVQACFTLVWPNRAVRSINFSLSMLLICAQCAGLMLWRVDTAVRSWTRGLGWLFTGLAVVSVGHGLIVCFAMSGGDLRHGSDPWDVGVMLSYQTLSLVLSLGLLLMVNQRCTAQAQADLEQRQQVEAALREGEERYRNLFANNHAAMLIIDPQDGRIIDANPAACRYYGWARGELLQKNIHEINTLPPAQVQAEMALARSEQRRHFNFQHRLADGSIRDVEVFSGPISLQSRSLLYSIIHDVTERNRAQEQLKELVAQREWLVRDSYHRVKNNLMVIQALLDMQASEIQDDRLQEAFQASQSRIQAMLLIHEQLYQSPDLQQVNMASYLHRLIVDLFEVYRTHSISIELVIDVPETFLEADQALACGLLLNELICNALKHAFTGREQGRLSVSMSRENGRYALQVSDDGGGLSEGLEQPGNNSLGMSIVWSQVHKLRGRLELDRTAGTSWKIVF